MNPLEDVYQLNRITRGDSRIVIAILDGPVDRDHKCLVDADLTDLSPNPFTHQNSDAAAFHGTQVCSIIFGQGAGGVRGIAPNCRGLIIPIFRDGPTPGTILPCSQVELAVAIERAVTAGAHIINISGGQYTETGTVHPILQRAIDGAAEAGVLIVSATGNDACQCHHIPSAYSTVLAVGAHDRAGNALESSNWGERYRTNGVVALGENVLGAVPGGTRHGSGTSFATPIVSGVAALLMSWQLSVNGTPNGTQVHDAIIGSVDQCFESSESCQRMLAGKLNPIGALNSLLEESLTSKATERNLVMSQLPTNSQLSSGSIQLPAPEVVLPTGQDPAGSYGFAPAAAHSFAPTLSSPPNATGQIANAMTGQAIIPGNMVAVEPTGLAPQAVAPQEGVTPSACGCAGSNKGTLVLVIGEIGFDYGSEVRRDSIRSHIQAAFDENDEIDEEILGEERRLVKYFKDHSYDAESIIWTISLNGVPVYAVRPGGPYAAEAYSKLVECLEDNHKDKERASNYVRIPGRIVDQVTLLQTGQAIPVIQPEIRGMANWDTDKLVDRVLSDPKQKGRKDLKKSLTKILEKIYSEHQNLGIRPQDRAINYAASNVREIEKMISAAWSNKEEPMFFDNIEFEPSEICRPGSECWIIKINFFVHNETDRSRRMFRFTVDVSDVVPVALSKTQNWYVR